MDYRALGSPAALRRELLRLGSNAAAWNAKAYPVLPQMCVWGRHVMCTDTTA